MVWSTARAHECWLPAAIAVYLPAGGSASPAAVVAPAGDGLVDGESARMKDAGSDGGVFACGRVGDSDWVASEVVVVAPAVDGLVDGDCARMPGTDGDGGVFAVGRVGTSDWGAFPVGVVAQQAMVWSTARGHACPLPVAIAVNLPSGTSVLSAAVVAQQAMVWSTARAHEYEPAAAMAVYSPSGASVCPRLLSPQQAMVWSTARAHEWAQPVAMGVSAGVVWSSGVGRSSGVCGGWQGRRRRGRGSSRCFRGAPS